MDFTLLERVGFVINIVVTAGYCLAGSYIVCTVARYIKDYKDSVEREEKEVN